MVTRVGIPDPMGFPNRVGSTKKSSRTSTAINSGSSKDSNGKGVSFPAISTPTPISTGHLYKHIGHLIMTGTPVSGSAPGVATRLNYDENNLEVVLVLMEMLLDGLQVCGPLLSFPLLLFVVTLLL